ncbi:hypothetical protein Tco_0913659, partial [Tanacetum coccineum]
MNLLPISQDNKRSHTIALKAKLRSIKLGDLTTDAYLRKIESLATILKTLGSPVRSDDVVTFALEGLPDKYDHVCGIITHREPFRIIKTAHSMFDYQRYEVKSKSLSLTTGTRSSSNLFLMADTGGVWCRDVVMEKKSDGCFRVLERIVDSDT